MKTPLTRYNFKLLIVPRNTLYDKYYINNKDVLSLKALLRTPDINKMKTLQQRVVLNSKQVLK